MRKILALLLIIFIIAPIALSNANAQTDPSYIYTKKTKSGFVYKSDTRPFTQRPQNPAAIDEKWPPNVDQMVLVW